MEQERDFKGIWIPKEIWLDERLNALDKIILMEIDSLDCSEKGCFASNKYLADFCQCSENKVSATITKLVELGYITRESFDGRTRFVKSRLIKNISQTHKICEAETQNLLPSNIYNNINNNKKSNIKDKSLILPKKSTQTKQSKKEKSLNNIIAKFEEYEFSEKVQDKILDFYSDRIDKGDYPANNQIIAILDDLAGASESKQLQAIEYSLKNGYKGIFLDSDKKPANKSSYNLKDDYSGIESWEEQQERVRKTKEMAEKGEGGYRVF